MNTFITFDLIGYEGAYCSISFYNGCYLVGHELIPTCSSGDGGSVARSLYCFNSLQVTFSHGTSSQKFDIII